MGKLKICYPEKKVLFIDNVNPLSTHLDSNYVFSSKRFYGNKITVDFAINNSLEFVEKIHLNNYQVVIINLYFQSTQTIMLIKSAIILSAEQIGIEGNQVMIKIFSPNMEIIFQSENEN